jgi:hypothetical protein
MSSDECSRQPSHSYEVAVDGKSITFSPYGVTSHHPRDVQERYCARCRRFLADVMETERGEVEPNAA